MTILLLMRKDRKLDWICVRILRLILREIRDWLNFKLLAMREEFWVLILKKWLLIIINLENVRLLGKEVKVSRKIINIWFGLSIFLILMKLKRELSFIHRNYRKLLRRIFRIMRRMKGLMNFVWMSGRLDIEFLLWQNHRWTLTLELRRG